MARRWNANDQRKWNRMKDRALEQAGALNYQTAGLSQEEIAARMQSVGVGGAKDSRPPRPPGPTNPTDLLNPSTTTTGPQVSWWNNLTQPTQPTQPTIPGVNAQAGTSPYGSLYGAQANAGKTANDARRGRSAGVSTQVYGLGSPFTGNVQGTSAALSPFSSVTGQAGTSSNALGITPTAGLIPNPTPGAIGTTRIPKKEKSAFEQERGWDRPPGAGTQRLLQSTSGISGKTPWWQRALNTMGGLATNTAIANLLPAPFGLAWSAANALAPAINKMLDGGPTTGTRTPTRESEDRGGGRGTILPTMRPVQTPPPAATSSGFGTNYNWRKKKGGGGYRGYGGGGYDQPPAWYMNLNSWNFGE